LQRAQGAATIAAAGCAPRPLDRKGRHISFTVDDWTFSVEEIDALAS